MTIAIDQACGYIPDEPKRIVATREQEELSMQFAKDIVSDFRYYYPDVLKNAPSTASLHLRNTIARKLPILLAKQTHGN